MPLKKNKLLHLSRSFVGPRKKQQSHKPTSCVGPPDQQTNKPTTTVVGLLVCFFSTVGLLVVGLVDQHS